MNCPKCGEDWSDVAVVRNAKREALAPPSDPAAPTYTEIRRHRRLDSLPKDVIPEMQRRLRDICEAHGWPVPKGVGHGE